MGLRIDEGDRRPPDDRLARLEAEVERLRSTNSFLLAAAIVGPILACIVAIVLSFEGLTGPGPAGVGRVSAGVVEAHRLVIRDEAGAVRATLGYEGDREVGLRLYDGGRLRSDHRVGDDGVPSTSYHYTDEKPAVSIVGGGPADPSVNLFDRQGDVRAQLFLVEGVPALSLNHSGPKARFQAGLYSDGVPYMEAFDERGRAFPMLDRSGVPLVGRR